MSIFMPAVAQLTTINEAPPCKSSNAVLVVKRSIQISSRPVRHLYIVSKPQCFRNTIYITSALHCTCRSIYIRNSRNISTTSWYFTWNKRRKTCGVWRTCWVIPSTEFREIFDTGRCVALTKSI